MFDNFISPGEFNAEMWNSHIQDFCAVFNLKNLIEKTFCFKNLEKPRGIYHILTNYTKLLENSGTFETILPGFHTLTHTVL